MLLLVKMCIALWQRRWGSLTKTKEADTKKPATPLFLYRKSGSLAFFLSREILFFSTYFVNNEGVVLGVKSFVELLVSTYLPFSILRITAVS